jgi:hypothetical protein
LRAYAMSTSDPAGNQSVIGDIDEYKLVASILASLDLCVQRSAVIFIEAIRRLRGLL